MHTGFDLDATVAAATPAVDLSTLAPPDMTGQLLHAAADALRAGDLARAFSCGWHGYCAAAGGRYDAPLLMSAVLDKIRGAESQQLELCRQSLAIRETAAAWLNGALALVRMYRFAEAYVWAERARVQYGAERQNTAAAVCLLADISTRMGRTADAIELYELAANLHGSGRAYGDAKQSAACLYAATGQWEKAWEGWALRFATYRPDSFIVTAPRGESDLAGKRVLLYMEQGLGDQIQFAQCIRIWRWSTQIEHLTIACSRPLIRFLAPLADAVVCDTDASAAGFDAVVPSMDLALRRWKIGLHPLSVAGARPMMPQGVPSALPPLPGDKFRIGVVWQGNPAHLNDWARSYPVHEFSALDVLLSDLPVEFVSLQPHRGEPGSLSPDWPNLQDWREYLGDSDINEAAHHLGLVHAVVTVDSAYAHLCGAIGKRAYVVHGWPKEWRWTAAPDMYGGVLVHVEQDTPGDHLSAIRKVADMIRDEVAVWLK